MKLIFVFLAIIGISLAAPKFSAKRQSRSLRDDFDKIEALIPVDEIKGIYHKYENDADIQKVVMYLKSKDFAAVAHIVAGVPEVQDLVSYLESKNIHVVELLNKIADDLGLPHWPGSYRIQPLARQQRSLRQFLDEVEAALPMDDIVGLVFDLLANSDDFQELYKKIAGVDYQKLHDAALTHPEIVDMIQRLEALGVDVKKVWETVKDFFGWTYSTRRQSRSLRDDFDKIEALIPVDEIKGIYHKYENDADIQKVVMYLKSKDFAAVAHIVAGVPEVQDLVSYLESKNIHVVELLNKIADDLGLPHWPGSYRIQPLARQQRSLRQFLDEVEAALPMDDIVGLVFDLLANSDDFQALYNKIAGVDYQKLHDAALTHPEIVDMIQRLEALGVDVKKVWETVKDFFGWTYSTRRQSRSLRDDFDKIEALIPVDEIKGIYHKYENDADIQKVVMYLKSKDFAAVAHIVAGVPEVQDLVSYLESKNIHVVELLNKIADDLGLPHWPGSYRIQPARQQRSLRQFLDEVEAALPMDDIVGLVFDLLANSDDFQELYNKIAGVDYQKLHDAALTHPEIVDMIERLESLGVDVKKVWETVKDFFGWTYSTRRQSKSLRNDFDKIEALIPVDQIKGIYHKYENDPDMVKVREYLKGKDFAAVAHIVANVPEIQALVKYLESKDIHVIELLNKIADDLGLPHWPGSYRIHPLAKQQRSLRQFLDEVEAAVPLEDIEGVVFDLLANSEDFQDLYNKISGVDYQKIHDAALSHPEIVNMLNRIKALGVDVMKIWEAVKEFFGWE